MKKCLVWIGLGLLLTAPGACTCDGGGAPESAQVATKKNAEPVEARESAGAKEKPSEETKTEDSTPKTTMARGEAEPSSDTKEKKEGEAVKVAEEEEGARAEAAEGMIEPLEENPPKEGEEIAALPTEPEKEPEPLNPTFDEVKQGDVYEGPPSKAVLGKWKVVLPNDSFLKTIDKELQEQYQQGKDMTLVFKKGKVSFQGAEDKKPLSFSYKVDADEDVMLRLSMKTDEGSKSLMVAFIDQDNIVLHDVRFPTEVRASRVN